MKKKFFPLLLAIIILFLGVFVFLNRYPCIRVGMKMSEAQKYSNLHDGYFIVTQNTGATGSRFLIAYGEGKGIEVELIGNCPDKSLSSIFFLSFPNFFLVQGEEMNTHNRGKQIADGIDSTQMYTIDVKQWEIIVPIYRDYQYANHTRWFYPLWYIDSYDVDNFDYHEEGDKGQG